MAKSAMIRARIEPQLKNDVERILSKLGLSTTEAISLFYNQVKLQQGLPFQVRIPNKKTIQTFEDTDNGNNLVECDDVDDMFNKLGL